MAGPVKGGPSVGNPPPEACGEPEGPRVSPWVGGAESVPLCDGSAQRGVSGVRCVEARGGGTESAPRGGPDVYCGRLRTATGGSSPWLAWTRPFLAFLSIVS